MMKCPECEKDSSLRDTWAPSLPAPVISVIDYTYPHLSFKLFFIYFICNISKFFFPDNCFIPWSSFHLATADLAASPKHGKWQITTRWSYEFYIVHFLRPQKTLRPNKITKVTDTNTKFYMKSSQLQKTMLFDSEAVIEMQIHNNASSHHLILAGILGSRKVHCSPGETAATDRNAPQEAVIPAVSSLIHTRPRQLCQVTSLWMGLGVGGAFQPQSQKIFQQSSILGQGKKKY